MTEFKKCVSCGSICAFGSKQFEIINGELFLNFEYKTTLLNCSRNDNIITANCGLKKLNPNSKEYVMLAYGFNTLEEANDYILKRNKSPFYRNNHDTEEAYANYQRRDENFYGSEEKYKEILTKISLNSSKEGLIKRHGNAKADKICKSKDSSSKKYFIEKYGEDWEFYYLEKNEKTVQTLENFIQRYGQIIGEIKYNLYLERKKDAADIFFQSLSKEERSDLFDTSSKKHFIKKYGENWEFYYFKKLQSQTKASSASKESLKFFDLLISKIGHLNYNYYIGTENNKEWFIYDTEKSKFNLYDFCIKELKIIVEFHGSLWHYNPNYNYDRGLPFGMTLEENKLNDEYKQYLAIKNGFDYYIVFDTDDYDILSSEISQIIFNKHLSRINV